MEKTIEIKGIDLAQLIGPADANLKMVEDAFSSQIIVRGSKIKIIGEESEVLFINDVFHEMGATLNRKGSLTQKDVKTLINVNKSQNGNQSNISESTILYGKNGAISARSKGQEDYINKVINNDIVFSVGPAGTGKTYLAVAFAVSADTLTINTNQNNWDIPYINNWNELEIITWNIKTFPLSNNTIEIIPLAYMRGRTLNNAFMILDEAQNATTTQMKMFLTRLGVNSKTIITGDVTQVDLPKKSESGLIQVIDLLKKIDGIEFCMLSPSDVVRHKLVKDIIKAYDKQ